MRSLCDRRSFNPGVRNVEEGGVKVPGMSLISYPGGTSFSEDHFILTMI
jgi:hypothetical protein